MNKNEVYRKKTINNIKEQMMWLRQQLDEIEEDLNSDDEGKNIKACYYGIALRNCIQNLQDEVDKLIKKSIDVGVITLKDKNYGH
jgi:hypothetical protein